VNAFTPNTGTIFDNPWFTAERPIFKRIQAQSEPMLDAALIILGLCIIMLAFWRGHAVIKAIVIAWIVCP
jgi:hypothetical protein